MATLLDIVAEAVARGAAEFDVHDPHAGRTWTVKVGERIPAVDPMPAFRIGARARPTEMIV